MRPHYIVFKNEKGEPEATGFYTDPAKNLWMVHRLDTKKETITNESDFPEHWKKQLEDWEKSLDDTSYGD